MRLDPYIQKFVSNTVSYCIHIAFSPYLFNPSTMIYTTPSGRISSAELLRQILAPLNRAYNTLFLTNQRAIRRRGSLSERYFLIRLLNITLQFLDILKLPDLYRICVTTIHLSQEHFAQINAPVSIIDRINPYRSSLPPSFYKKNSYSIKFYFFVTRL